MNLALGALIILVLLLPALFFRLGITAIRFGSLSKTSERNFPRELARKNFINVLARLNFSEILFFFSIIPLILHCISLCILTAFGQKIDYTMLLNVFSSQKGIVGNNPIFNLELIAFLEYSIVETVLGFLLGIGLTQVLALFPNLMTLLIGDSMWFRLFTGLMLDPDKREQVDLILVDILTETKENSVIYSGFLEKFDVKQDTQELAYISLIAASRRDLRKQSDTIEIKGPPNVKSTSFHKDNGMMVPIPGKYFTIPGHKIHNVNVTYLKIIIGSDNKPQMQEVV